MITYLNKTLHEFKSFSTDVAFRSADFHSQIVDVPGSGETLFMKGSLMYSFEIEGVVFIVMHWAPALKRGRYVGSFSVDQNTESGLPEYYEITDGFDWLQSQLDLAANGGKKVVLIPHHVGALDKYLSRAGQSIRESVISNVFLVLSGHDHDQWGFYGGLVVASGDAELKKDDTSGIPAYFAGSLSYEKFITVQLQNNDNANPSYTVEQYTTDTDSFCTTTGSDNST